MHSTFDTGVFLCCFFPSNKNFKQFLSLFFVYLLRKWIFPIWITWQQRRELHPLNSERRNNSSSLPFFANGNFHKCISITVRYVALFNHSSRFFFLLFFLNTQEHWIYFVSKIIRPISFIQHFTVPQLAFTPFLYPASTFGTKSSSNLF